MAFRADEAARMGYERAVNYLISRLRDADESQRTRSKEAFDDIVDKYVQTSAFSARSNCKYPMPSTRIK
jgi:hypothetical protein